jgi:Glycerophosphoryl diester phosphodiesterase family
MNLITHRGINITKENFYSESTREAFLNQLQKGFGLEFDIRLTKDKKAIILHDPDLRRVSHGKDTRLIEETELKDISIDKYNIITLEEILDLIDKYQNNYSISAIHIKGQLQSDISNIDTIINIISLGNLNKFFLFDIKIEIAQYIKSKNKNIKIAPSVSHIFDIERFNVSTKNTLINIESLEKYKNIFDWVWLDEWDKKDYSGKEKELYSEENIKRIKDLGILVAIVSPELHATSPVLQSTEKHPDGVSIEATLARLEKVLKIKPDAICTDYAEQIKKHFKI